MSVNDSRSMNGELFRGATDGKLRNMRPDSANADYSAAEQRSRLLHPTMYGTMGLGGDSVSPFVRDAMPDSAVRKAKRDIGIQGY